MKFLVVSVIGVVLSAVAVGAYQATKEPADEQHAHSAPGDSPAGDPHAAAGQADHEHVDEGHAAGEHHPRHKIVATRPVQKNVVSTQQYVCQIHSRRHIEVRALEGGYLESIPVSEGQWVQQGSLLFKILPILYKAKLDSDLAEAQLAQVEFDNTKKLVQQNIVSDQELKLAEARLAKANAQVALARAELGFADIKAPFDGIVDRQMHQEGSLIEEGEILTTLSDNSVMWVYFNVPEARYLDYEAQLVAAGRNSDSNDEAAGDSSPLSIELRLANGATFPHQGAIGAVEADFNNETGNIAFRADFPNPDGLLRNGQTGTVLIHRELDDSIVIPQRATFEVLAKQYAFIVDGEGVVHQREIVVQKEMEDVYVIESGLDADDTIVFEGVQQVRDGDHVEFDFREPDEILVNLKNHAE